MPGLGEDEAENVAGWNQVCPHSELVSVGGQSMPLQPSFTLLLNLISQVPCKLPYSGQNLWKGSKKLSHIRFKGLIQLSLLLLTGISELG